jgi:hypothetical protein
MMRWVCLLLLVSCATDEGHPPVARIVATPSRIVENDGFQTPVTLDGTTSDDPLDDPDGTRPLAYRWEIEGDEVRVEPGESLQDPIVTVTLLGARPATVRLTVSDEEGLEGSARLQIQLTLGP